MLLGSHEDHLATLGVEDVDIFVGNMLELWRDANLFIHEREIVP